MGNSEVGHLNLGAGAVVRQDLTRIDDAVEDGVLDENAVLRDALRGAERVHLIGLVSDGGVHSGWRHLHALIRLARDLGVPDLVIHAFTDGRDTSPTGGEDYLRRSRAGARRPATRASARVIGRYFAMDRDKRWDRDPAGLRPARPRARRSTTCRSRRRRRATPTSAARPTSSSPPTTVGDEARDPPGRQRHRLQLPARPDARDHARARRAGLRRDRPRRRAAARALRDADRVRGGLAVPGRVPARAPERHAPAGDRARRRPPAARRRDREVPARDVLLRRRRGDAGGRASGASSCRARATCRPTTTSRR